MSTTASFQNLLNQYLPIELLEQEYIKRDYLMQRVNMDDSWKGGTLIVPFESQHASSIEFGQLADITDISQYKYQRGQITTQPEAWASMLFNHKDLIQHDGKIPESTFLRILPDQVEAMLRYFKMVISVHLMGGPQMATATVTGTAGGVIEVDRVDRFTIDQKLVLNDDGTVGQTTVYIIAIDINGGTLKNGQVTVSATRGGAALDVHLYTTGHGTKFYNPGSIAAGMTSMRSQILSLANGGSANLFGVSKLSAPFLQAVQYDGSGVTNSNILIKIFDLYKNYKIKAQGGKLPEVVMSFVNFGACLKQLDVQKGPFNVVPNSRKVSSFGWDTIEIGSVDGQTLKLVGIQEAADDVIAAVDWESWTFFSNGLFRRRRNPDGREYFEARATTGYSYVLDHALFGDLVCTAPWKNAVMYGVPALT